MGNKGKGRGKRALTSLGLIGAVMSGGGTHHTNLNKANYDNAKNYSSYSTNTERNRNGRNARNGTNDRGNRTRGSGQRYN